MWQIFEASLWNISTSIYLFFQKGARVRRRWEQKKLNCTVELYSTHKPSLFKDVFTSQNINKKVNFNF